MGLTKEIAKRDARMRDMNNELEELRGETRELTKLKADLVVAGAENAKQAKELAALRG